MAYTMFTASGLAALQCVATASLWPSELRTPRAGARMSSTRRRGALLGLGLEHREARMWSSTVVQ
uniref:Secreted protein n=1 Tax=Arundo donax TaxID=35708 RepID=A0A0A9H542_ARUDO